MPRVINNKVVFSVVFFAAVLVTSSTAYYDGDISIFDKDYIDDPRFRLISKTEIPKGPLCPAGWKLFETSCFLKVDKNKRPNEAERYCKKQDAFLASIDSELEKEFLSNMMNASKFIIGLKSRFSGDTKFGWVDGSTSDYREWAFREPRTDSRHRYCVYIGGSRSKFYSERCLRIRRIPFVCKRRIKML